MFVGHVDHHADANLSEELKTASRKGCSLHSRATCRNCAADGARSDPSSKVITGLLSDIRGGDIVIRGIGMAISRGHYLYCTENEIDLEDMAKRLAKIDWHILDCERDELEAPPTYAADVRKHAHPIWGRLLVMGENRYRVSSSSADADVVWDKSAKLFSTTTRAWLHKSSCR